MTTAYIVDGVRTPIGRYGGALAAVRPDDLAAHTIRTVLERHPELDPARIDDVLLGCANQAGEDNRNVARMAALLAGLPETVPGATINRLCGSGLDAVATAARSIVAGEHQVVIAGGVESMSRAPFVLPKAGSAFSRNAEIYDTTLGWRFVNPVMEQRYGIDSMAETAENVAEEFGIDRADQDAFALRSQQRAAKAIADGRFDAEIVPVTRPGRKGEQVTVEVDEHPRETSLEALAKLKTPFRDGGTVTAGNASTLNDGAACLLMASEETARELDREPLARVVSIGVAGVDPAYMGIGPVPATLRALEGAGLELDQIELIELNEAFASQVLACADELGIDGERLNVNGGAIALGHPLGCSGARLMTSLVWELRRRGARYGLATLCVGVGQGVATVVENTAL
jgi:3-oxoadipyl-CoA thiolase